jgi:sporulation protein YqfD
VRKNIKRFKKIESGLYHFYEITGVNLDFLLNSLIKAGVGIKNAKKPARKKLKIGVLVSDEEKFFAITKNLCYNIKKIGEGGKFYPLIVAKRNICVVLGALIFVATSVISNDYLLKIDFEGSGKSMQTQVLRCMETHGVKRGSRFSEIDLDALSSFILAENDQLVFASCYRQGARLKTVLVAKGDMQPLGEGVYHLFSGANGVVESVTVYRGTALVKAGDRVSAGDLLVGGYAVVKDKTVVINVLARVEVICEEQFFLDCELDNFESGAESLAVESLNAGDIVNIETKKTKVGNGFNYQVKVFSRKVFFAR